MADVEDEVVITATPVGEQLTIPGLMELIEQDARRAEEGEVPD